MSIESGDYKINVGEKGQLHYDAYEKRFFVEEDEWTKFHISKIEEGVYTVTGTYPLGTSYTHIRLVWSKDSEGTEPTRYPVVDLHSEDPVIWKIIPYPHSNKYKIVVYDGAYKDKVWTTSDLGVVIDDVVDQQHAAQQQFTFTPV